MPIQQIARAKSALTRREREPRPWVLLSPGIRHFLLEALIALSLAFLVWLYTRSRAQATLDDVQVPVQITMASGTAGNYELEIHGSSRVPVSFTGPPSRIRELRGQLQRGLVQVALAVSVPEEKRKDNTFRDTVKIEAGAVPVPPGVQTVVAEGHNTIPVTLHRMVERHLPVKLDYTGDVRISGIKLEPATVPVRGPKAILDRASYIATQPYTVPTTNDSPTETDPQVRGQASLVAELEGRRVYCSQDSVSFRFRIHPRLKTFEVMDVPVHFLCPPEFAWRPRFAENAGKVSVKVIGPATEEPPSVVAFIDLTHADVGRGRNVEPLRLQLPRDYQLAEDTPRPMAFYLEPIERAEETGYTYP